MTGRPQPGVRRGRSDIRHVFSRSSLTEPQSFQLLLRGLHLKLFFSLLALSFLSLCLLLLLSLSGEPATYLVVMVILKPRIGSGISTSARPSRRTSAAWDFISILIYVLAAFCVEWFERSSNIATRVACWMVVEAEGIASPVMLSVNSVDAAQRPRVIARLFDQVCPLFWVGRFREFLGRYRWSVWVEVPGEHGIFDIAGVFRL
jgi:hypothetical protein